MVFISLQFKCSITARQITGAGITDYSKATDLNIHKQETKKAETASAVNLPC